MSRNAFNLSKEAVATFKAPSKSQPKQVPIKPVPVEELLDEFDRFDELFLQLNNALIEKHDELDELQKALKEKEAELIQREREVNDDEAINLRDKRALKEEKKKTEAFNKELTQKNARLDQYAIATKDSVPDVFYYIPSPAKTASYPMFNQLNELGSPAIYTQARACMKAIDRRLRQIFSETTNDDKKILMISGAYYQSIFPCETYEEIAAALSQYINCLIELNDGELNKALNDMRDKVLEQVRKLAKG